MKEWRIIAGGVDLGLFLAKTAEAALRLAEAAGKVRHGQEGVEVEIARGGQEGIVKAIEDARAYRGEHGAPGEEGAPLFDLTVNGVYPADVYSVDGRRLYGASDGIDAGSWGVVWSAHHKPKMRVRIYRMVPRMMTPTEQIDEIEQHMRQIMRHGRLPRGVSTTLSASAYYNKLHGDLETLRARQALGAPEEQITAILPGDWVAIDRGYAVRHSKQLGGGGRFRMLSKLVPASALRTNGDSIEEWGYTP